MNIKKVVSLTEMFRISVKLCVRKNEYLHKLSELALNYQIKTYGDKFLSRIMQIYHHFRLLIVLHYKSACAMFRAWAMKSHILF